MTPLTCPRSIRRRVRLAVRAVVAISLVAGALGMSSPNAHAVPCAAKSDVTIPARSFNIEAEWSKKVYRVGETAILDITVTRPSHQDPVTDEGNDLPVAPPAAGPAEEVTVGVGVYLGQVFLSGGGITDADGHLTAKIKIQKYVKPGPGAATIYAYKRYLGETRCVYLQEFGYKRMPEAFTVTR